MQEKVHDERFSRLLGQLLKAGYIEYGHHKPTRSGTPQGGPISPILANMYLDKLDRFVENTLMSLYSKGNWKAARNLKNTMRQRAIPNTKDHNVRRLRYIRYADDFLIGFTGLEAEVKEVKKCLKEFLKEKLKLELSEDKTLITYARMERAQFLGYEIKRIAENTKHKKGRKSINNALRLSVPAKAIKERCNLYKKRGRVIHRAELVNDSDYDIVNFFQSRYAGYVQYYMLAHNVHVLNELRWVMETSLLMTLAKKHKTSVNQLEKRYKTTIQTPDGPRKCLEIRVLRREERPLIARFGGIPLRRQKRTTSKGQSQNGHTTSKGTELIQRLLSNQCECCGSAGRVEVHHIRKLADIGKRESPRPRWMREMIASKRKTLIVCKNCHRAIHSGKT